MRIINIIGNIDESCLEEVLRQTNEIRLESSYYNPKAIKEPLLVNISSGGGSVTYGNAIIDELKSLDIPVITRSIGVSASMAYLIFLAGDYRIMEDNSVLMYHGSYNEYNGSLQMVKNNLELDAELESMGDYFITKQTDIKPEKLDYYKQRSENWYMFKDEAVENMSVTHDLSLQEVLEVVSDENHPLNYTNV